MPSGKDYLKFVLDQLSDLDAISYRQMMGEYIIYFRGKIVGGVFDDRFLVKITHSSRLMIPEAPTEVPYEGGRKMLLVEDVDDRSFMTSLLLKMYDELPEPKNKSKNKKHIAREKS